MSLQMCPFDAAGARVCHHHCPPHFNQTYSIQVYLYSAFYDTIVAKRSTGN